MSIPLADRMRPQTIDEVVGQRHILSKDGILYRIAQSGRAANLIFYGPPGTGKTTVARIIAKQAGKKLYKLNGTTASTADFKEIISSLDTLEGATASFCIWTRFSTSIKSSSRPCWNFWKTDRLP